MNVVKKPVEQQYPLQQDGFPLFYVAPESEKQPIRDDVAWNDDYLHIVVVHHPIDYGEPLYADFWDNFGVSYPVSMALADLTRCTYRIATETVYDRDGNMFSDFINYPSIRGTWEDGSDRFWKALTTTRLQSRYTAGAWRMPSIRVALNPMVGYGKNDISIRMKCCWYARATDSYDEFDPDTVDPIPNFSRAYTVYAWRDSDDTNSFAEDNLPIPIGAVTMTGTFGFFDFATSNQLDESDQIVNVHWDNDTDSIILT